MKRTWHFVMAAGGIALATAAQAQVRTPAPPATPIPPGMLEMVAPALEMVPPSLEHARAAMEAARFQLEGLAMAPTPVPDEMFELVNDRLELLNERFQQQGSASDSIYSRARAALNRGDYREAVRLFQQVSGRYPKAPNASDALYWEAYARRRMTGDVQLRAAIRALEKMQNNYSEAALKSEAAALETAIRGELARSGDARSAEEIAERAELATQPRPPRSVTTPRPAVAPRPPRQSRVGRGSDEPAPGCPSLDDDERMAALNALLQMDAERAMPTLQKVLARRDACSELLRRRAVFLVSQQKSPESADILLNAAKTDPDLEVQRQAVFWLGQVRDERAADLLTQLLKSSTDDELTDRALFALSQHKGAKAGDALRAYAEQANAPDELRGKAIFWLGQDQSGENAGYLKSLYPKLQNDELKERVLFSLSQMKGFDNPAWLLGVAQQANEPIELRKKALFWVGQMNVPVPDLTGMYDKVTDREMKEQLIFVYSQRQRDTAAVDKLMAIAKNDLDKELRGKALFWLAQTKDPRVVKFLEDLINQ